MIGPWTRPERMRPFEQTRAGKIAQMAEVCLFFVLLIGAAALARRQYKREKGDRQGALRLARTIFLLQLALWLFFGHFVADFNMLGLFALATSTALFTAALSWVLYMALEPYVRKLWPQTIISWSRLVSGRVRDPLVGRDALFGVVLGLTWVLIYGVRLNLGVTRFGVSPQLLSTDYLLGLRSTVGAWIVQLPSGIQGTLFFFFVLVMLRFLLRKPWAAGLGFVVLFTVLKTLDSDHLALEAVGAVLVYGIAAFALVRFGLITLAVAVFVANTMLNVPVTFDFSRWYAPAAMSVPVGILAFAVWSFYTALGGQKLIKSEALE